MRCTITMLLVKGNGTPRTRYRALGPELILMYKAVSPPVTLSHPPDSRLPLLFARPADTFPAEERHRPLAGTKLYCLVTEAHACEQLAKGCCLEADRPRFEPASFRVASERSTVKLAFHGADTDTDTDTDTDSDSPNTAKILRPTHAIAREDPREVAVSVSA